MVSLPSESKRYPVPCLQALLLHLRLLVSTATPDAVSCRFVSFALRSSKDKKIDYHERIYEHERDCQHVSFSL